jgi:hypothetical protein
LSSACAGGCLRQPLLHPCSSGCVPAGVLSGSCNLFYSNICAGACSAARDNASWLYFEMSWVCAGAGVCVCPDLAWAQRCGGEVACLLCVPAVTVHTVRAHSCVDRHLHGQATIMQTFSMNHKEDVVSHELHGLCCKRVPCCSALPLERHTMYASGQFWGIGLFVT